MVGWRSVGWASGGEDLLYEGSYRRSLAPGWQLSASGSYFRPSSAEEGKINGSGELSYEGTSLRASAGLLRDAWLRKSVARGRVGTKTLPYVNFELSGEETYWDDYDLVSYRTQLTARTYEYAVPLHPAVQGFHRYAFTVTDYDGTSWQETLTGTLGVRVGKPSSQLVLSYSPMRIWGQTPVLYRETVGDRLDAHLYLSGPMGVLTARTGYNVPLARYDDLVLRASSGPSSQAELAYDLNAGQLKTFGGGVRIRVTEAVTVGVAGRYDARQMSLEELRTSAEVVVAPGVTLEYEQTTWSWYRRTTSTWRVKGDLHCRTVHLVWKPQEGTFFVELLFKAFPQDLLRLGNDVRINL
ncbi:MAG: hypothetical protein QJR13_08140 [Bacillota bacterium]|nr:hypothetical protein [Bacillota bacterium]